MNEYFTLLKSKVTRFAQVHRISPIRIMIEVCFFIASGLIIAEVVEEKSIAMGLYGSVCFALGVMSFIEV